MATRRPARGTSPSKEYVGLSSTYAIPDSTMESRDLPAGSATHTISGGVVYLKYSGMVTAEILIAMREQFISDPAFAPGMSFLVDFREASLLELDEGALRRVSAHGRAIGSEWGAHRSAVVAPSDLEFGVSRIFAVIGERPGLELQVFRDLASASQWLAETEPSD